MPDWYLGSQVCLNCFWRPKSGHPVPDLFPRLPYSVRASGRRTPVLYRHGTALHRGPFLDGSPKTQRAQIRLLRFWRRFPKKRMHFWTAVQKCMRPWRGVLRFLAFLHVSSMGFLRYLNRGGVRIKAWRLLGLKAFPVTLKTGLYGPFVTIPL